MGGGCGVAAVMLGLGFCAAIAGLSGQQRHRLCPLLLLAQHDRWTPRTATLYGAAGAVVVLGLYVLFKMVLQVPLP